MGTLYVVAYDVPDNRRRNRLFRLMRGFGRHSQFSVFECHLDRTRLERMVIKIRTVINPAEDNVKIYPLCLECCAKAVTLGVAHPPIPSQTIVV